MHFHVDDTHNCDIVHYGVPKYLCVYLYFGWDFLIVRIYSLYPSKTCNFIQPSNERKKRKEKLCNNLDFSISISSIYVLMWKNTEPIFGAFRAHVGLEKITGVVRESAYML